MRGGRICLNINNSWCNNIKVRHKVCSLNLEMLTLSVRPFYLPQEFSALVVCCVYISPSANTRIAAELVADNANSICLFWMISTHADWIMYYHHFSSMWRFQLGGQIFWICVMVIFLMHSGFVHIHRLDLQITMSSVYFRSTDKNWNVTSHNVTVPHSGWRMPLPIFKAP